MWRNAVVNKLIKWVQQITADPEIEKARQELVDTSAKLLVASQTFQEALHVFDAKLEAIVVIPKQD